MKGINVCGCDRMQTFKKFLVHGCLCDRAIKIQAKGQRVSETNFPTGYVCLCLPVIRNSWLCFVGLSQGRKTMHIAEWECLRPKLKGRASINSLWFMSTSAA